MAHGVNAVAWQRADDAKAVDWMCELPQLSLQPWHTLQMASNSTLQTYAARDIGHYTMLSMRHCSVVNEHTGKIHQHTNVQQQQ